MGSEISNQKLRSEKFLRKCFWTRVRLPSSPPLKLCNCNGYRIAENKSKTYDGTALSSEGIGDLQPVDGLAEGHTLTGIEFRGSQTNAGSSKTVPQNATIKGPKSSNYYDITYVPGTLTVTPLEVTVYIDPDRYTGNVYNGTQYNAGFCNPNKQPEDYINIPNAAYKNAHLSDFVSQIEANRVLFSKIDAGHWTKTANEIKALFTVPEDDNYTVTLETREAELEIKPVDITITSATLSKEYDGTALTNGNNEVTLNGAWVGSDGATYSFTGSQLTVGSSSNAFTYTLKEGTKAQNYNIVTVPGTLTVTDRTNKYKLEIEANSTTAKYDGTEHTAAGLKQSTFTVDGNKYTVTALTSSPVKVNAGEYPNAITKDSVVVKDALGNDVTDQFDVTTKDGKLTIDQRNVTLTSETASKAYDGTALTKPDVTVGGDGFVAGEVSDIKATGSVTTVEEGEVTNTITYKEESDFKSDNYTITKKEGTLKITPIDVTVTITGKNNTTDYDGDEHEVTGYDVKISNKLYKESDFTFSGTAEAKRTDAGTTYMGLAEDQFTNTNKNFKKVTFNVTDGYQTISKINAVVTVEGNTSSVDYDGKEHSISGYTVTNVSTALYPAVAGTDFKFTGTAEAKRTDAGKIEMGLDANQFANMNPNFETVTFNVTDGYQEIKPIDVTVTITGKNNTADYDGTEYKVTGYTAKADSKLYDVDKDFTFSGTAEAKRTDAGTTDMGLAEDQFTNTNKNFKKVTFNVTDGYQTISKINATVTIEGNTSSVDYDGTEHSISGYTVTNVSTALYPAVAGTDFTFSGTAEAKRTDAGKTEMGLDANQFANNNPNFETVTFNVKDGYQEIKPIDVTVTITGNNNTTDYDEAEHKVTGYTASADSALYDVDKDFTFSGTAEAKRTDVGTTYMNLAPDQFMNTNANFDTVTFEVTDGYQTINKADGNGATPAPGGDGEELDVEAKSLTVKYDGKEHTVKATATKDGSKIEYKIGDGEWSTDAPSRTNAGTTEFSIRVTNPNYNEVVVDGYTLTVTKRAITLTSESDKKVYDGKALTNHKVIVSGDGYADGESAAYTFSGSRTNVGTSQNTFDVVDKNGSVIKLKAIADSKGIDEQNYDITKRYGTLTVTKAPLTITTSSASKAYDGKALTADAKVDGLVNGETVTIKATGSQTEVGSSKNTYSLKWNGTASESNYEITEHLGTLTITESNIEDDASDNGTTPPSGNTNPGRGGNGGNPPAAVNGGTTRTNGALTASTNTPSASTVPGAQDTDPAPQDLTEIEDQKTPLANAQDKWALLNLILMILTVLLCLWMAAGTLLRNQDDDRNEDEKTVKRKKILKLLSLIPAIAAVIAFILTEDMTLPMQMTDKWTILMLVIFIVQVVMRVLTKNKKDEEDNNKNAYA